jgi:hypothetical protein
MQATFTWQAVEISAPGSAHRIGFPHSRLVPFAIKNLLNEEGCFGGGQPCGLAAASARGRRPPKAGGGPTKYHQLAFKKSLHQLSIKSQLYSSHPHPRRS